MKKLSLLIPIYNGAKYIDGLMNNILNQITPMIEKDIEVLLINDGSKDNSFSMLKEYSARYPDILKIETQENEGIGITRNRMLSLASGMFVWYIDQDDFIEKNILQEIIPIIEEKYDLINIGHTQISTSNEIIEEYLPKEKRYVSGLQMVKEGYRNNALWDKIINKKFLLKNNLSFGKYNGMDDFFLSFCLMAKCTEIKTIHKTGYYHIVNPKSYSQDLTEKVRIDWAEGSYSLGNEIYTYVSSKSKYEQDILNIWFSLWLLGFIYSLVNYKYSDNYDLKMLERLKKSKLYPIKPKMRSKRLHLITYILNNSLGYRISKFFLTN